MFGSISFTLDGQDPVQVTPRLGDMLAWERETGRTAADLAEGRMADVAWIAWHAWARTADHAMPYEAWEGRLVDLDAEPADPTAAGTDG